MDKVQWQQIEKIFYAAMELPREERDDFIRQACAGNEELYNEVRALLNANRKTESFLDSPAALPHPPVAHSSMRVKYCPKCSQVYSASLRYCQSDREVLSLKDPYHLVGLTLMDKYKILALVGLGGMGAVYCAHHLGIDRRVAFKILQPNVAIGSDYVVELFEREAKLAGRLAHENVVDVKDAGHTPDGIAYIVMEWLEGQTLDEKLSGQGRFDFKRAIGIIRQITAALNEAHAKRVVHRDLKPGNIMLVDTPDGHDQVKVLDFGIGKIIEETTANSPVSALVGTPQYASPEQLTVGGHIDGRSDIYSLGVIFYRLLGGQLPFNCSSMGELLQMQLTVTPPSLRAIRPETPLAIEALINNMLAKEPAARPQSASEVFKLLDRILAQLPLEDFDSGHGKGVSAIAETVNVKPREAVERTTEVISGMPPPPKSDSGERTRVRQANEIEAVSPVPESARQKRAYLLYAMTIAAMMLAGSYGLYRYRVNDGRSDPSISGAQTPHAGAASPSPSQVNLAASPAASAVASPEPSPTQTPAPRAIQPSPTPAVNRKTQVNAQKAAEHLQRAGELYRQLEYQSALRECNESLKLNPQQPEARELQRKLNDMIRIKNRR